jgi:hypothetical protein
MLSNDAARKNDHRGSAPPSLRKVKLRAQGVCALVQEASRLSKVLLLHNYFDTAANFIIGPLAVVPFFYLCFSNHYTIDIH